MAIERASLIVGLAAAVAGIGIGLFTGDFARASKQPGEALRTEDATGFLPVAPEPSNPDAEKITNARIRQVMAALEEYALVHGNTLPEALDILVTQAQLKQETIVDGWGRPLHYTYTAEKRVYTVSSFGADGIPSADDIPRKN